jgi:hypothetical protein
MTNGKLTRELNECVAICKMFTLDAAIAISLCGGTALFTRTLHKDDVVCCLFRSDDNAGIRNENSAIAFLVRVLGASRDIATNAVHERQRLCSQYENS